MRSGGGAQPGHRQRRTSPAFGNGSRLLGRPDEKRIGSGNKRCESLLQVRARRNPFPHLTAKLILSRGRETRRRPPPGGSGPARKNSPYEMACRNTVFFLIQPCFEIQRGPLNLPSKSLEITAIPSAIVKEANRASTSLSSVLGYSQSSSGKAIMDPRTSCKARFLPRDKPIPERRRLIPSRSSKAAISGAILSSVFWSTTMISHFMSPT